MRFGPEANISKIDWSSVLVSISLKEHRFALVTDEPQNRDSEDPFGEADFPEDPFIHSTPAPGHACSTPAPAPVSLSEEQQRRIELNKQLALERRLARMQQQQEQGDLLHQRNVPKKSPVVKMSASKKTQKEIGMLLKCV